MRSLSMILLAITAFFLIACGGGGGGGGAVKVNIIGRVLNVETGGAVNPAASVQGGGGTTLTSLADGSFTLSANRGTSSLLADTLGSFGVFTFSFPAATATTDVGDLWVGPERVTLTGTVRNSTNGQPVSGATVTFAGRTGVTNGSGVFSLAQVAFSTANPTGFYGIFGNANATGFFRSSFTAQDKVPTAGVITVDDVFLTPSSDVNPPSTPYNIWGRVLPGGTAPGTTVTLRQGGTAVREVTVGADGAYFFWVPAGNYTIDYVKGALTAPTQTANLTTSSQVIQRDVTLQ